MGFERILKLLYLKIRDWREEMKIERQEEVQKRCCNAALNLACYTVFMKMIERPYIHWHQTFSHIERVNKIMSQACGLSGAAEYHESIL